MGDLVGEKALRGEWEKISNHRFEIVEDMTITFEGLSCNITDSEDKPVYTLSKEDGNTTRDVLIGYQCYVMRAWIKFEKK
jgi:hypothetical protein